VTVDLVCGEAAFVDVTLVGLEALPAPGEERHARDLVRAPGGAALTAIAASRLDLDVALSSPLGADPDGDLIREAVAAAGVRWTGREVARTPVTIVLPAGGERAMATYDPGEEVTAQELAAVAPRAAVLGTAHIALAPSGTRVYVTLGDPEARAGLSPEALEGAHALLVNEREATLLTGRRNPEDAARQLNAYVQCAIVTCGAAGAVAVAGGSLVRAAGIDADPIDTTGAGDLFCAAYVWADTLGLLLEERLQWAVLYAALSVEVPTGVAGAVARDALLAAGERRGLTLSAQAQAMSTTRRKHS
jgi:sugar/nucleoside kinase (ribokinase family)